MANVERYIPFVIKWETGKTQEPGESLRALFERSKKTGMANDPDDLGGLTMVGLTFGTFQTYCKKKGYPVPTPERLLNITFEQWMDVLKTLFWDRWKADEIKNESIACICVDWVWASGVHGIKNVQKVLGVTQDGIVGPKTLEAINTADSLSLWFKIKNERIRFINRICEARPASMKFKQGWLNRINDLKYES